MGGSDGKESACSIGDLCLIPGLGRSLGEGESYPLQYCGLENSIDCIVHAVAKSRTQLSNFHFQTIINGSQDQPRHLCRYLCSWMRKTRVISAGETNLTVHVLCTRTDPENC